MSFILTLVASDPDRAPLSAGHMAEIQRFIADEHLGSGGAPVWLDRHKAADISVLDKPVPEQILRLRDFLARDRIDIFVMSQEGRRKKLLIADMDATIVEGETLDELATHAGLKDKIAPITERAMRGELDFIAALKERVALLSGLETVALQQTLARTRLNAGARLLARTMAEQGAVCVLVSGGFTYFTETVARSAGFGHHHGNILEIVDERLNGSVTEPILDKNAKVDYLRHYREKLGLQSGQVLAIGDGANDLPMLAEAGLGIGFHPKPLLLESLDNCIIHGDLTAALYAQGYSSATFSKDINPHGLQITI